MTPRWLTLPFVLITARFGVAESACAYVTVEALSGSSLDTGHGTLDLAAYERGEDSPTLYVDFDTHVNFTAGTGWRSYTAWEDGVLTNGICGTACGEDERVSSGTCVACLGGSTNGAGDDIKGGGDTYCACAENERVEANACEACESGKTRPAGDPVPGGDTSCAAFAAEAAEAAAASPPSPPASPPPPPGAPLVLVEDDVSGARRCPRGIGIIAAAFLAATTLGGSRSRERWRVRARA